MLSLDDKLKRRIARGRGKEAEDVLHEFWSVVADHIAMAESLVHLEGLDHVTHLLFGLLGRCNWPLGVVGTEEETKRSRIDQGQIEQISLLLTERCPVAVRVPLESVLLCVLGIVVE